MSTPAAAAVKGQEHWTKKGDVKLFLWEKEATIKPVRGTILFVHGSSMASTPTFDLQVPGRPYSSAMDYFASEGFDTWCFDMEGYGRSDKIARHQLRHRQRRRRREGRDRLHHENARGEEFLVYGISSGALRAAMFAERHPERVARLALDAFVWTGKGSPTLDERRKKLPQFLQMKRRPIDRAFMHSIFERDHPGCAEKKVVEVFADAVLALDDSMPTGNVRRYVLEAAGRKSGKNNRAHR